MSTRIRIGSLTHSTAPTASKSRDSLRLLPIVASIGVDPILEAKVPNEQRPQNLGPLVVMVDAPSQSSKTSAARGYPGFGTSINEPGDHGDTGYLSAAAPSDFALPTVTAPHPPGAEYSVSLPMGRR